MSQDERSQVKTAGTTLRLLETLKELDGAGVTEVAEHLGMSKSNVYKYLSTLEQHEYVVKRGTEYHLGLKLLDLGGFVRDNRELYQVSVPEIKRLAAEHNETANLQVEEYGRIVMLINVTSDESVNIHAHAGMRLNMHTTGSGKAMLAYLPDERVDEIIEQHGLPELTENTITDREELLQELETIRERGYAFTTGEAIPGLRSVAVPITASDGAVLGAISVTGPARRLEGERFESEIPEQLVRTKNVIELNHSA
ncbi:IclR family transcriptional regulator [Haloglomus litoreum]|uniref:IclR family transcriptional regulator n=1 Tax=Haloglomus litoreum TaxID=3034026 RepID=UPI0023E778D3|nr:IclR family transcriptional regulator [Haloglomus sp. DT116]